MGVPKKKLHLFEGFGVELEYMIVSRTTLNVSPIADQLFHKVSGEFVADIVRGPIAWSNELVSHVIELKTNGPASSLNGLDKPFHQNILEINGLLASFNAMLLPTGAHPWMDPYRETVIWPHEFNEIYTLYNQIFDCRGHGWSNLQSTHINLPFANEEEFARLHAAIRVLLPLIPALAASTPVINSVPSGFVDTRLEYYRHNQAKIPSIAGKIIPEAIFTYQEYDERIFSRIRSDIAPWDADGILDRHFLNSRGAISRFDRGAIEIRIIDIQECPLMDIAILQLIVNVLKRLVSEEICSFDAQKQWHEDELADIFLGTIKEGSHYTIANSRYLQHLGLPMEPVSAGRCLQNLILAYDPTNRPALDIASHGNLSERMLRSLNGHFSPQNLQLTYSKLASCLQNNIMFLP